MIDLSIVIPAYNEAKRLDSTLEKVQSYFAKKPLKLEVLVVDDGSTDGTVSLVKEYQKKWPALRCIENKVNQGKGRVVQQGALEAKGEMVLFSDADLSTPIEEFEKLREAIGPKYSIAIASRSHEESWVLVHQAWYREAMGKVFNLFVKLITGLPFNDTQCGFKLFTREAAQSIFPKLMTYRFAFDVEILTIARNRDFSVREIPARWVNDPASRVNPLFDSCQMLWDLIRIRYFEFQGHYTC